MNPFQKLSNVGAVECSTKLGHTENSELNLSIPIKKVVGEIIYLPTYSLHFYSTISFTVDKIMKVDVPKTDAIKKCELKKKKN